MATEVTTPTDAVLELLTAALTGRPVYDGHVPTHTSAAPLPPRYAVLYGLLPLRRSEDIAHHSDLLWCEWQVTAVGATRPEVDWIRSRARDALVDRVLVVPGLAFEPLQHLESQPQRWDDDIPDRVALTGVDLYGCNATLTT